MIVAPADGKIITIKTMEENSFLKAECVRVSTFMNIFSVHVNRAPISGRVVYCHYNPGKFISAFKEKASLDNEQFDIGIEGGDDKSKQIRILVKLIAGLVARRIVVWKREGDELSKGERMSLIKLGSRVDLYLPPDVTVKVQEGDWVKAGKTVIGTLE
jgi:phosphatidylserine decarboxylase